MKKWLSCVAVAVLCFTLTSGCGGPSPQTSEAAAEVTKANTKKPARYGGVIGLKPEKLEEYKRLHADVWPEVLATIKDCNIQNYSIFLGKLNDGNYYLFSYFEYTGDDFEADMKKMAADSKTQEWWELTDPCQIPQDNRKPGEHWMLIEEVFHTD